MYSEHEQYNYKTVNGYNVAVKLWTEYLEILDMMEELKRIALISAFDNQRTEVHERLVKLYKRENKDFNESLFNDLCHNLDKVIKKENSIEYNSKVLAKIPFNTTKLKYAIKE